VYLVTVQKAVLIFKDKDRKRVSKLYSKFGKLWKDSPEKNEI